MSNKKSKSKSRTIQKRRAPKINHEAAFVSRMNRRLSDDYHEALELYNEGDFEKSEQILLELNRKGNFLPVIELLSIVYFETEKFNRAAEMSRRLLRLVPDDPDARLRYASAAMFEGYATIAMSEFQEVLRRWPQHESVRQIKDSNMILTEETTKRIAIAGFPSGSVGLQLQVLHEESLMAMANSNFDEAISKCKKILEIVPEFCSARNNLALASFQAGKFSSAVEIAETTTRLQPNNRFAAVLLAKLKFLSGNLDRPEALLEELINDPPTNQDAAIQAAEWMAMAGYDEELIRFFEALPKSGLIDPLRQGLALHLEAYARCRLGQTVEARKLWQQSLKILPNGTTAQENLDELARPEENATWAYQMGHWVPRSLIENLLKFSKSARSKYSASSVPTHLRGLLPAFLDRGDPELRQLAVAMCLLDRTTASVDLLKQFAFSNRGSDFLRNRVLMTLLDEGLIDKGPHRVFLRGKFTEIKLTNIEIHDQPKPTHYSKDLTRKMQKAFESMTEGDLDLAEKLHQEILEQEPECTSSQFNLATIWLQRDGREGQKRAQAVIEAIHRRDPDYLFAGLALAQFHCERGELEKATDILKSYADRERLHISEAKALYAAQAQIALAQGEQEIARGLLKALEDLVGDDPMVIALRKKIEHKGRFSRMLDLFKR